MVRVTDEAAATEKIVGTLDRLPAKMQELAAQNPQMAMMAPQVMPATNEKLSGFRRLGFAMAPMLAPVVGVADGHVIIGSSEEVVALCLATGAGEHPNVTKNELIMSEALVPPGPFTGVAFDNKRAFGAELAGALAGIQMAAGMAAMAPLPPEAHGALTKGLTILGKLTPAVEKINFYKSAASYTTFDGQTWYTRKATHYVAPAERI
jgi:hypothetical protein